MFRIISRASVNRLKPVFLNREVDDLRQLLMYRNLLNITKKGYFSMRVPPMVSNESFLEARVVEVTLNRSKSSKRPAPKDTSKYDDDSDSDAEDAFEVHQDDSDMPDNYKDLEVQVQSLRADAIVARSLNASRNVIDDAFLGSKLRFNDDTLKKKSRQVSEEDCLELIVSVHEGVETFKRVRVLHISNQKTSKERYKVKVRAWRGNNTREVENTWVPVAKR